MINRVIKKYKITDSNTKKVDYATKIPRVLQNTNEVQAKKVEIPGETIPLNNKPVINVNRNDQGIVISIDVICGCGEKFSIELEY
jgi:sensor histidine kinase regulating citrate/malate metabolism